MSNRYQNLIPLTDRVIIEPEKAPEKIGSIFVPERAKEKPQRGTVVAVGRGRVSDQGVSIPMTVKPGDTVMFNFYSATEFEVDGEKLFMLHEHEISCVIKK